MPAPAQGRPWRRPAAHAAPPPARTARRSRSSLAVTSAVAFCTVCTVSCSASVPLASPAARSRTASQRHGSSPTQAEESFQSPREAGQWAIVPARAAPAAPHPRAAAPLAPTAPRLRDKKSKTCVVVVIHVLMYKKHTCHGHGHGHNEAATAVAHVRHTAPRNRPASISSCRQTTLAQ